MFWGFQTAFALLCFLFGIALAAVAVWQVIHNTICIITARMCRFIPIGDGVIFIVAAGLCFWFGGMAA